MPRSMTAFGRGQAAANQGSWVVEIKTVNSRYLDIQTRMPNGLMALEDRIKKAVEAVLDRGRVTVMLNAAGAVEPPPRLVLNLPLVKEYARVLDELKAELGIASDPGLGPFLANRDIIQVEDAQPDYERMWKDVEPAVQEALAGLIEMREKEGKTLAKDLSARLERLAVLFEQTAANAPQIVHNYRERLRERLAVLMEDADPDPQRVALEVAVIADKCDITEEAVRARSHLKQFAGIMAGEGPVGRKLDFLVQELNREANTMGSKSPDAESSSLVVEIKAELEKIREQVQNLE